MKSHYSSVNEQTGLFAGHGGFSITVGNHTQLDGAVIASQADPSLNQLTTGTLGFSDIDNHANYTVKTQSIGLGTGGDPGASLISNMASNMLTGASHSKSDSSVTHAAIAPGSITITDKANQTQDINTLSRDTANANNVLNQIFDKEKEQHRLDRVQAVGRIVSQVTDIAASEGSIQAAKARKDPNARNTAKQQLEAEGKPVTEQAISQRAYDNAMRDYGTGSALQQGISAAGAVVMGFANDDWKAAVADGASPYIAGIIHTATIDAKTGQVDKAANLTAHAIVNAALAIAKGGGALDAATQASGAVSGEATAIIASQIYNKSASELTESERQIVSNLATVAGGLAGGLVGGNSSSAATGAMAGKNSAEFNSLSGDKARESVKQSTEYWKDQIRETLGDGTTSAIANSIINAIADTGDTAIGSVDYVADAAMALASCAAGDSYCTKALSDLSGKNQAVADSVTALMKSETWSSVADTLQQASEGNQAALEATGGMLAGALLPGKKVPHTPNAGAVGNMSEFFKQPGFGSELKDLSKKTSKQYQGQSVYKADKPVGEYIKRGDQFYLDAKHKDHIEVFDSTGIKVKAVLNLDGSYNKKKTEAAIKEWRRLPK